MIGVIDVLVEYNVLILCGQLADTRRPDVGSEDIVHVFQVLSDLGHSLLFLLLGEIEGVKLLCEAVGHDPVHFTLDDVETLDVSQLDLLSSVLHLLHFELHLVQVFL